MQRRTFLGALTAAFTTTVAGQSFALVRSAPVRYDLFCGDNRRYDLAAPFQLGQTVYATDARILISHQVAGNATPSSGRFPAVQGLWWDLFDGGGWRGLGGPQLRDLVTEMVCPTCMGTGRVGSDVTRCSACRHVVPVTGEESLPGCSRCTRGWRGGTKCLDCTPRVSAEGGEVYGYSNRGVVEVLGGFNFQTALVNRIRTLPGEIEWKLIGTDGPPTRDGKSAPVLAFRWGNTGRGLLMGLATQP